MIVSNRITASCRHGFSLRRSFRNRVVRIRHRLSMTRAEFNAICIAGGLLLFGYGADSVAHWRSRLPSDRYARDDSIFFALAEANTTAVAGRGALVQDTTTMRLDTVLQTSGDSSSPDRNRIDLNSATHAQLVTLPGIGPALARRIIESRQRLGPFASVSDLQRVSGIGPAKTRRISALVVVVDTTNTPTSHR